jgi:multidrug efflux pump subunit AcrA (membrane-fusion protein)
MRQCGWLQLGAALAAAGAAAPGVVRWSPASPAETAEHSAGAGSIEVKGVTQPVPGRAATIAPAVLHPVEEVRVAPGDRVRKGQPLVKLDDDEARADVRAKAAALAELKAGLRRLQAQPRAEERAEARAALEGARESARETGDVVRRLTSVPPPPGSSSCSSARSSWRWLRRRPGWPPPRRGWTPPGRSWSTTW